MGDHEFLREALASFELCALRVGTEHGDARLADLLGNAFHQRSLGADNHQVDSVVARKTDNGFGIFRVERNVFRNGRRAAVARSDIQLADTRRFCNSPRQSMFAATAAQH